MINNIIYKYRSNNRYALNILEKGELWFSNPQDFNDPFDCRIEYKELSEIEKKQYINNLLKKQNSVDNAGNMCEREINEIIYDNTYPYSPFRVLSLTKDELNILMWSHYANNHKGFCIGIKAYNHKNYNKNDFFMKIEPSQTEDKSLLENGTFLPLVPVVYDYSMPKEIDLNNEALDDIVKFFIHKSHLWSYEKEYRGFLFDRKYNAIKISKDDITEIIFGLKTDCRDIMEIINIVKNYKIRPKLYQCEYIKGKYAILKKEISYSDI